MVTVTTRALERLEEKLRNLTANPRVAFRMTALSLSPVRAFLMLDDEREDDRVLRVRMAERCFSSMPTSRDT